ncbi:LysR family transcriptional regulator [Consotaella salsifontis]|uniref:Transcriptional regulator, LysR family n=1 Tax=Consotaella salsifontis TaxID=1365950 RepID=A0A1T4MQA5_9HYPH|nr:LysR family transcriptional regulator [Consotaella salsifontis]SJZ68965.1 transcriptional regulator, LysR family [Consotaella salsifontis]
MARLNWDDARVFLALARDGTLTGAAKQLNAGVATVSRRIERLEAAIGMPLFLRHQSGYRLSDQGAAMLPRAEAVELAMREMRLEVDRQTGISGLVRLASVESLVTPLVVPALAPLLGANPGLDVEILFNVVTVNLQRRDADLALRMVQPQRGHLKVRQLASMGFGLYGPPEGTRPQRLVTWPDQDALAVVLAWSQAFGEGDAPRFAVNTVAGQIEAVRLGVGVAVLPHILARAAGLRLLTDRLPDGEAMQRPIYLVSHADIAASQRVLAVAETVSRAVIAHRAALARP